MAKRPKLTQEAVMAVRVYEDARQDPSSYNVEVARLMAVNSLAGHGLTLDDDDAVVEISEGSSRPVAVPAPLIARGRMTISQSLRLALMVFALMIPVTFILQLMAGLFIIVTVAGSSFSVQPSTSGQVGGIVLFGLLVMYVALVLAQGWLLTLLSSWRTGGVIDLPQGVLLSLATMVPAIIFEWTVVGTFVYALDLPLLVLALRLWGRPHEIVEEL